LAKNIIQQTPLHIAVSKFTDKHAEISELLIENGAEIDAVDNKGESPIFIAVKANNMKMVKLLKEKGANLETDNYTGYSILHYAAEIHNNTYILEYLIRNTSNDAINTKNIKEETPLHLAAEVANIQAAKLLVENGADIDAENNDGETPAARAEDKKHIDVEEVILYTKLKMLAKTQKPKTTTRDKSNSRKKNLLIYCVLIYQHN
jgi:ankyrin repeat protein